MVRSEEQDPVAHLAHLIGLAGVPEDRSDSEGIPIRLEPTRWSRSTLEGRYDEVRRMLWDYGGEFDWRDAAERPDGKRRETCCAATGSSARRARSSAGSKPRPGITTSTRKRSIPNFVVEPGTAPSPSCNLATRGGWPRMATMTQPTPGNGCGRRCKTSGRQPRAARRRTTSSIRSACIVGCV